MLGIVPQITGAMVSALDPRWKNASTMEKLFILNGTDYQKPEDMVI